MTHVSHGPIAVDVERHAQSRPLVGRHGHLGPHAVFDEGPLDQVVVVRRKLIALNDLDGHAGATTALGTDGYALTPLGKLLVQTGFVHTAPATIEDKHLFSVPHVLASAQHTFQGTFKDVFSHLKKQKKTDQCPDQGSNLGLRGHNATSVPLDHRSTYLVSLVLSSIVRTGVIL